MTVLAAVSGAGFVLGVWLVLDGFRPQQQSAPPERALSVDPRRLAFAVFGGIVVLTVTRWPVAAVAGAVAGGCTPTLLGARAGQRREIERTEALAAWTEMLRDTVAGAHGLEEAITTSADVAPAAIQTEVRALAERLRRRPIEEALADFGRELAHPIGDLVVTALLLAAAGSSGDLHELLGTLAVSARDEAGMRLRVEATRARLRTAVRVIASCTATTAIGLVVLSRSYLKPYGTPTGQVVLAFVVTTWGVAMWWLTRMGEYVAPERYLASTSRDDR